MICPLCSKEMEVTFSGLRVKVYWCSDCKKAEVDQEFRKESYEKVIVTTISEEFNKSKVDQTLDKILGRSSVTKVKAHPMKTKKGYTQVREHSRMSQKEYDKFSRKKEYDVKQNPKDKKWYVMGYVGGGYWMPASSAMSSHEEGLRWASKQKQADAAAKRELIVGALKMLKGEGL